MDVKWMAVVISTAGSTPVRAAQPVRSGLGIAPAALLAATLALGGCHGKEAAVAPPAIVVALPVRADAAMGAGGVAMRYPVEATPRYSNAMSFRVPGKLIERKVRIGDTVSKGEVIARLDPADAQKQAASAKAALQAAEHRLVYAQQQLDRDTA